MEHILYWLWLTGLFGVSSGKFLPMIEKMGGIECFYNTKTYPPFNELSPKIIKKLNNKSLDWAKSVYDLCQKKQIQIITFDSDLYPKDLKYIFCPPMVLYAKGIIPDWDKLLMISVVGTRKASEYGLQVTASLSESLAKSGITIVSGFALGVDSEATKSALKCGAFTIAVCGCGLDVDYPKQNRKLKEALLKNGLFLSEYPPETLPVKWTFPPRNRIIAGISKGVLVTEAPKKSGALITADRALDENRDVFAVPGQIDDINFVGINDLIKNGAKPVFSADDILCEYTGILKTLKIPTPPSDSDILKITSSVSKSKQQKKTSTVTPKQKKETPLQTEAVKQKEEQKNTFETYETEKSPLEKKVLALLETQDMHIDEIMRNINEPVNSVQNTLFLLELCKNIERLPGNVFHKI